jgi:hypothetical protein
MSWSRDCDTVSFACDSGECQNVLDVDGNVARLNSTREATASTFAICNDVARGLGWVSFKRVGRPWTYHCSACAEQAECDHEEYLNREQERERIKQRNG